MLDDTFFFTGVGARDTPWEVQKEMTQICWALVRKGGILRSGGQRKGADGAWERGAGEYKQIFKPPHWDGPKEFEILPEAYVIAERHHQHQWHRFEDWTKNLMARNVHAVLGPHLTDPSEFLLCWTADGIFQAKDRTRKSGGTGHAISVACEYGVPVFNMNNRIHYKYITETLIK